MTPCPPCVHSKRARMYVQNVSVCTDTTRTCFNTCTRGARAHEDVLNVHAEAFFESTHGFFHVVFSLPQHTQTNTRTHTHTHTPNTPRPPNNITKHTTQHNTHTSHGDRERQTETRQDKTRQDGTRQKKRRQEKRRRDKKREETRR